MGLLEDSVLLHRAFPVSGAMIGRNFPEGNPSRSPKGAVTNRPPFSVYPYMQPKSAKGAKILAPFPACPSLAAEPPALRVQWCMKTLKYVWSKCGQIIGQSKVES